jgi:predicted Zn-dependent protease with MMP-like domain
MTLSSEELVDRAWEAIDDDELDEAEACARRALMVDRASVDARLCLARALTFKGEQDTALDVLEEAASLAPDSPDVRIDLAIALFEQCEFPRSQENLDLAAKLGGDSPEISYWNALLLERRGDMAGAERLFARAHRLDPVSYAVPVRTTDEDFVASIEEARARLPRMLDRHLENVAIMVEDLPDEAILRDSDPPLDPCLAGLFVGVPLGQKTSFDGPPRLPDTIFLFKRNIERASEDRGDLIEEIRTTLYHEIGHYVGYDEDELADRGFA